MATNNDRQLLDKSKKLTTKDVLHLFLFMFVSALTLEAIFKDWRKNNLIRQLGKKKTTDHSLQNMYVEDFLLCSFSH